MSMPLSSFTISLSLARLCRWLTKITLLTPADVIASTCFCTRAAVVATSVVVTTTGAGEEIVGRLGVEIDEVAELFAVALDAAVAIAATIAPLVDYALTLEGPHVRLVMIALLSGLLTHDVIERVRLAQGELHPVHVDEDPEAGAAGAE